MKRFYSIVFITIFLTYHLGYYGIYLVMHYKIESHWNRKFSESGFDASELDRISTPLSLPYTADQQEYRKATGSININGRFYRFVKYRYAQDSLHLLYVKDHKMENLHKALRDWAILFTSVPVSENGNVELWKSMCKDFIFASPSHLKGKADIDQMLAFEHVINHYLTCFIMVPSPPPKA